MDASLAHKPESSESEEEPEEAAADHCPFPGSPPPPAPAVVAPEPIKSPTPLEVAVKMQARMNPEDLASPAGRALLEEAAKAQLALEEKRNELARALTAELNIHHAKRFHYFQYVFGSGLGCLGLGALLVAFDRSLLFALLLGAVGAFCLVVAALAIPWGPSGKESSETLRRILAGLEVLKS